MFRVHQHWGQIAAALVACSSLGLLSCDSAQTAADGDNTSHESDASTSSTAQPARTTDSALTDQTTDATPHTSTTAIAETSSHDSSANVTSGTNALETTSTIDDTDDTPTSTEANAEADASISEPAEDAGSAASIEATTSTNDTTDPCSNPNLTWRSGHKTNYESYPDPGSEECIEFNGCYWAGMFAACEDKMSEEWVEAHNIVALFPHFEDLALHDLCLRRGNDVIIVTVYDTCGDSDCDGCCTENRGSADALIDLEKYTNERWGLPDGDVEWADLGLTASGGCE